VDLWGEPLDEILFGSIQKHQIQRKFLEKAIINTGVIMHFPLRNPAPDFQELERVLLLYKLSSPWALIFGNARRTNQPEGENPSC